MHHFTFVCRFLVISITVSVSFTTQAQLAVNNATNATDAVQTYLLGDGVVASNITYTGNNDQIASFTCTNCNLDLPAGVVMSSGNAATAVGPNNSGSSSTIYSSTSADPDLNAISAVSINDAAILQFDFVPTGDSLVFNYVFGSDEYPEFTNSTFNDAFGFFLSGPGITGPYQNNAINIAQIPGTSLPVSINNLNNGATGTGGPCEYCQFYIHNGTGTQAPYNGSNLYIQPDGFTVVLQAFAEVQCGETYHIKLAIADGGDGSYNSWVFLESGSFESNTLDLSFNQPGLSPTDNSMYEGCEGQSILFTRPAGVPGDLTFNIAYSGTATNGVDYDLLPLVIEIPADVDTVIVPVVPIDDDIAEGGETITLTVDAGIACANNITLDLEIYELAELAVILNDITVPCNTPTVLNPAIIGGYGNYLVSWDGYGEGDPLTLNILENTTINYTITDVCSVDPLSGSVNITMEEYDELIADAGDDVLVNCQETASIIPNVDGGNGDYNYEWFINGESFSTESSFEWDTPLPSDVQLVVTDGCGSTAESFVVISIQSPPVNVELGEDITTACFAEVTVSASVDGGIGAYTYEWEVNGVFASDLSTLTTIPDINTVVTLTVVDECGAVGVDNVGFVIPSEPITVSLGNDISLNCLQTANILPTLSGGTGNYIYSWLVNGIEVSTTASLNLPATDNTTISLIVSDECGAIGMDELVMTLSSNPITINLAGTLSVTCLSNFTIAPPVSGGVGTYQYVWSYDGLSASSSSITYNTDQPFTATFTVTDQCGNTAIESIDVMIAPSNLLVNINASDTDVCPGEQVVLTTNVSGAIGSPEYSWSNSSTASGINVSSPTTTTYELTVTDDCNFTAADEYTVEVLTQDFPITTGDVVLCSGVFTAEVVTGGYLPYTYSYSSDSLFFENGSFTALFDDYYDITVVDHCGYTSTFELYSKPCSIIIPNVFTPDGDGKNGTFEIVGINGFPGSTLIVFNRWGKEVYQNDNYDNDWSGDDLAEGTYFYVLNRVDGEGFSGTITLLRN